MFTAGEVPVACADLASVKAVEFPGQPFGGEEHFDRPGAWREDFEGGTGTGARAGCPASMGRPCVRSLRSERPSRPEGHLA